MIVRELGLRTYARFVDVQRINADCLLAMSLLCNKRAGYPVRGLPLSDEDHLVFSALLSSFLKRPICPRGTHRWALWLVGMTRILRERPSFEFSRIMAEKLFEWQFNSFYDLQQHATDRSCDANGLKPASVLAVNRSRWVVMRFICRRV